MRYDYLIVGSGLYGAVFARQAADSGKKVLVLEKRSHIGGNVYTASVENIHVHVYGAHIFHTNDDAVWNYVNRFTAFHPFVNMPLANYKGQIYHLPFNMHTFQAMWGVTTPEAAQAIIESQRGAITQPKNLEEQAISLVGTDIYQKLVKGYTEKQWGRDCKELPAFIIRRLPVRYTYNNNYFDAKYQGIPLEGYTALVETLLEGIEVRLDTDYLLNKKDWNAQAKRVVYTGPIDSYFDYCYGPLQYRSVRFDTQVLDCPDFQGNAVVNYTDRETPWTRIIEHKHFLPGDQPKTVISREYSTEWQPGMGPYYPVNDDRNTALYQQYQALADGQDQVIFGGRLGQYRYFDMDQTVAAALNKASEEL